MAKKKLTDMRGDWLMRVILVNSIIKMGHQTKHSFFVHFLLNASELRT